MPKQDNNSQVLFLHWAGADWHLVQNLLENGKLPNLKTIVEQGVIGKLIGTNPKVSPMLTTSLCTGYYGDEHGILSYAKAANNHIGLRPVASLDLTASPLWQLVNESGKKAMAVGWPASHPTTHFDGVVISDQFSRACGETFDDWPLNEASVSDSSLHEVMRELRLHPSEISAEQILSFIPNAANIDQETDERLPKLVAALARVSSIHGAATWLTEYRDWDLLMVHFDFIEVITDAFLQYCEPRMPHVSELDSDVYSHVLDGAYQFMDLLLGRYLALISNDTNVFITSNHGYLTGEQRLIPKKQSKVSDFSRHFGEYGMITASGPRVKQDELLFGASILDVAPTLLTLLNLPVDECMPGNVLANMFNDEPDVNLITRKEIAKSHQDAIEEQNLTQISEWIALGYLPSPSSEQKAFPEVMAEFVEIREKSNLAKVKVARKKYEAALVIIDEILNLEPENMEVRFVEFRCNFELKRLDACLDVLQELFDSGVDNAELQLWHGQLNFELGKLEETVCCLEKAKNMEPNNWRTLERIGSLYLQMDKLELAQETFERAVELNPEFAFAYHGLGKTLIEQSKFEEAAHALMRSIGIFYQQPDVHLRLGVALAGCGKLQQAEQALQNALAIEPNFKQAEETLTRVQQAIAYKML